MIYDFCITTTKVMKLSTDSREMSLQKSGENERIEHIV